jgi:hypothetical protein
MLGDLTFTSRSIRGGDPITVTATLENVFNGNSPEAAQPLPAEATLNFWFGEGTAYRLRVSSRPVTNYSVCPSVINIGGERARLTFTLTPIAADGRAYAVTQMGGPEFVTPGTGGGRCADARDDDYQRPIAPSYRLRVEFQYDDGRAGVLEGSGSIRVARDDFP